MNEFINLASEITFVVPCSLIDLDLPDELPIWITLSSIPIFKDYAQKFMGYYHGEKKVDIWANGNLYIQIQLP